MLALDRPGRESMVWERPQRPSRTHGQRFALGGVAFELLPAGQDRRGLVLEPDAERFTVPCDHYPAIADVLCSVTIDDNLFEGASPYGDLELAEGAQRELEHGELSLSAPRVKATLCRLGPQRFACSARIASDPRALTTLLRSIVAVVAHASGGVLVHAAGVVLDEHAVLYLGPSGTGKSTAATLTRGAQMFAWDHVVLIPHSAGVTAYGMPGGAAAAMPHAERVIWPLGGVFRIMRDGSLFEPQARVLRGAEALFLLREAVECTDISASAEHVRLCSVGAIAEHAVVGTLHTVLGQPIEQLVRDQLREPTRKAGT